jgi:hypothetical protein
MKTMKKRLILSFALALMLVLMPITAFGSVPSAESGSAPGAVSGSMPSAVSGSTTYGKSGFTSSANSGYESFVSSGSAPVVVLNGGDPTLPPTETYKIMVAQHYWYGGILVSFDDAAEKLIISWEITKPGCKVKLTHLAIASYVYDPSVSIPPPDGLPMNPAGNPRVGHFPYSWKYKPPVTSDTYEIPWKYEDLPVVMAFHAEVICPWWGEPETAWANQCGVCCEFPGRNWATYFPYPHIETNNTNLIWKIGN